MEEGRWEDEVLAALAMRCPVVSMQTWFTSLFFYEFTLPGPFLLYIFFPYTYSSFADSPIFLLHILSLDPLILPVRTFIPILPFHPFFL